MGPFFWIKGEDIEKEAGGRRSSFGEPTPSEDKNQERIWEKGPEAEESARNWMVSCRDLLLGW